MYVQRNRRINIAGPAHRRTHWPRRKRRGLLSVLLTVAIVAIVVVALLMIYNQVNASVRSIRIITVINSIEASLRRTYHSERVYPAELTIPAIVSGAVSSGLVEGTGNARTIKTPYGGIIVSSSSPFTQFQILVENLPSDVCSRVTNSFFDNRTISNISIGGTTTSSVSQVLTQCDGPANDNDLVITFNG